MVRDEAEGKGLPRGITQSPQFAGDRRIRARGLRRGVGASVREGQVITDIWTSSNTVMECPCLPMCCSHAWSLPSRLNNVHRGSKPLHFKSTILEGDYRNLRPKTFYLNTLLHIHAVLPSSDRRREFPSANPGNFIALLKYYPAAYEPSATSF